MACGWDSNNGLAHSGHTHFQLWLTILASSLAPMKLEIIRAISGDKSLSVCSCHFPRTRTDPRREETLFDGTWRLTSSPLSFKMLPPQRWTQSVAWGWLSYSGTLIFNCSHISCRGTETFNMPTGTLDSSFSSTPLTGLVNGVCMVNLRYLHWPAAELCYTKSIFSNSYYCGQKRRQYLFINNISFTEQLLLG